MKKPSQFPSLHKLASLQTPQGIFSARANSSLLPIPSQLIDANQIILQSPKSPFPLSPPNNNSLSIKVVRNRGRLLLANNFLDEL